MPLRPPTLVVDAAGTRPAAALAVRTVLSSRGAHSPPTSLTRSLSVSLTAFCAFTTPIDDDMIGEGFGEDGESESLLARRRHSRYVLC